MKRIYPKTKCYFCGLKLILYKDGYACSNWNCYLEHRYTNYKKDQCIMFAVNDFCTIFVYNDNTMGFYFVDDNGKDYEILDHPVVKIHPNRCKKNIIAIKKRYKKLQVFK